MEQATCRLCKRMSVTMFIIIARFRSLAYLDTRALSLLSGSINMSWAAFVLLPSVIANAPPQGVLHRIFFGLPLEWFVLPIFLLGACEFAFAVFNHYRGRVCASLISAGWWLFLTIMSAGEPANTSAVTCFACLTIFRLATFLTIDNIHPEGKHYRA